MRDKEIAMNILLKLIESDAIVRIGAPKDGNIVDVACVAYGKILKAVEGDKPDVIHGPLLL